MTSSLLPAAEVVSTFDVRPVLRASRLLFFLGAVGFLMYVMVDAVILSAIA